MFGTVLLSLALSSTPATVTTVTLVQDNPPVQVWLNKKDYVEFGERVRVYVRSEFDGHMVIFHADPEGRVRVLYPLDPGGDDFIRGGREYEVEGRQNGYSFRAVDTPGIGTVFVAFSEVPFSYGQFVLNDHWDFRSLETVDVVGNAENELTALAQDMAQGQSFDYDLADYYVETPLNYRSRYAGLYGFGPSSYDPYYYGWDQYRYRSGFSVGLYFGHSPYRYRRSSLWYSYGAYYDPFYYDPFYYGYDPFYYGYGGYYGRGYNYNTVYLAGGRSGNRQYATVNDRYTFKTRSGQPYRVGMRDRSASGTTVASNVNSASRRPEPRRAGVPVTRRSAPGATVATTNRRAAPGQATGTRSPGSTTSSGRSPERRVTGVSGTGTGTTSPARRTTETARRTSGIAPAGGSAVMPQGQRRAPSFRSRSTTPRPSDAAKTVRRPTSEGAATTIQPSTARRSAAAQPSRTNAASTRSQTQRAAPVRSRAATPTTSGVRSRPATPTRVTTSTPRRTNSAARPVTQRTTTRARPAPARSAQPTTRRTSGPAARAPSRPAARPVSRPSSSGSRPAAARPVSRPSSSGSRPAAAPSRPPSPPVARPGGTGSRPSGSPATTRRRTN